MIPHLPCHVFPPLSEAPNAFCVVWPFPVRASSVAPGQTLSRRFIEGQAGEDKLSPPFWHSWPALAPTLLSGALKCQHALGHGPTFKKNLVAERLSLVRIYPSFFIPLLGEQTLENIFTLTHEEETFGDRVSTSRFPSFSHGHGLLSHHNTQHTRNGR